MAIHLIYKHFIADDSYTLEKKQSTLSNMRWFVTNIPESEFIDINRYFWIVFSKASSLNMVVTKDNINKFIILYLKTAIAETGIHVQGTEDLNFQDPVDLERAFQITSQYMQSELEVLMATETEETDFASAALQFFEEQSKASIDNAMIIGMQISSTGYRKMHGSIAAQEYLKEQITKIEYIYDTDKLAMLSTATESNFKPKQLITFGIPELDDDTLGLYEGQLFGIEAGSGVGKTRFTLGTVVYNALRKKLNVCYCALEQERAEIEAMLIARHIYEEFDIHVEDKDVYRNTVPMQLREKVRIAKYDLFQSGNYGKLFVYEESLYDNNLTDVLSTLHSFQGPFQLFVIDHMYLLDHKPTRYEPYLARHEIIANGYRKLKKFVKKQRYACIAVNQLNKVGMEHVAADKCPPQDGAAGGIEVYRNSDYNIVLAETEAMKVQQKMRIFVPKVRSSAGNINPIINAYKWNCVFSPAMGNDI